MAKKPEKPLNRWAVLSGIGIQMGATIWLGNLLGAWLDEKYNKDFLETAITLLAIFLAMLSVITRVNKLHK